jgi:hypothetical protein
MNFSTFLQTFLQIRCKCVTPIIGRLLGKERISYFEEIEEDKFSARELVFKKGKLPDTTEGNLDLKYFLFNK